MTTAGEAAERIGRVAQERALRRIEAVARDVLPADVGIDSDDGALRLTGRRLGARMVTDPRLRAFGMLVKELMR